MVVFTCNNCGESLQKPKVEKHYQTVCRNAKNLTCVDCFKDFRDDEFVSHIKCVTEEERYAAKGSLPNGVIQKGEVKQQSWTDMIKGIIEKETDLSIPLKNMLNIVASYVNVPRKKVKFLNFVSNSFGRNYNKNHVEEIWDLIEKHKAETFAKKEETKVAKPIKRKVEEKESTEVSVKKKKSKKGSNSNGTESIESEITCKEKKQKHKKNKTINEGEEEENVETSNDSVAKEEDVDVPTKKKKSKKHSKSDDIDDNIETKAEVDSDKPTKKKKKTANANKENGVNGITVNYENDKEANEQDVDTFSYEAKILEILNVKKQISIKKLEKKVLNAYIKHKQLDEYSDKQVKKFNKRLKKITLIEIKDDLVILK